MRLPTAHTLHVRRFPPAPQVLQRPFASVVDIPKGSNEGDPLPNGHQTTARTGWQIYNPSNAAEAALLKTQAAISSGSSSDLLTNPAIIETLEALKELPPRPPRIDTTIPSRLPKTSRLHDPLVPRNDRSKWVQGRLPVFFPDVTLTLVRPSRHNAVDPYTAVFRAPLTITKIDVFNYLRQIYGLGITSIHTAIYRGKFASLRHSRHSKTRVKRNPQGTYKKVWVGLSEPFFWPEEKSLPWLEENLVDYSSALNEISWYDKRNKNKSRVLKMYGTMPHGHVDRGYRPDILKAVALAKAQRNAVLDRYVNKELQGAELSGSDEEAALEWQDKQQAQDRLDRIRKILRMDKGEEVDELEVKDIALEGKSWWKRYKMRMGLDS